MSCPSCDRDLSYPGAPGHECYTYRDWPGRRRAPAPACLAGVVQPFADSHACICTEAEHGDDVPHRCEECGARWAG